MARIYHLICMPADFWEQISKRQEQFVCNLMNKQVEDLSAPAIEKHSHF